MHIAILGCGQLSRMLALAGIPLGFTFSFIADTPDDDARCVSQLGSVVYWKPDEPVAALYQQLGNPDLITVEKEQVDVALLQSLEAFCQVHPRPSAFAIFQDRSREKRLLDELQIPTAPHSYGIPAAEAVASLGLPLVAKSCRGGYDGKNQHVLKTTADVAEFDARNVAEHYIVEQWVPFENEFSVISARDHEGNIRHYPATENVHENGILRHSIAPARNVPATTLQAARESIARIMETTEYVGVMAMECFTVAGGLMVNEIAPRVHNSGHWTQTGCKSSQFENHLRAVAGLPLGSTDQHSVTGMVNLIGVDVPSAAAFSPHSTLHWYNKVVRPGRKLGHVNFSGDDHDDLLQKMTRFRLNALEARADS